MIFENLKKLTLVFFLIYNPSVQAVDDVAEMAGISEAAGTSAAAAVSQMVSDTSKVSTNIAKATEALGKATSEMASKLDVSIAQAQNALAFAEKSLAVGDMTAAIQTMSLVEGVTDMALGAIPSTTGLDMTGINFAEDFSPAEMAALSSVAGQMGVGKVMAVQKMAGQMAAVEGAGFDSKGMMGALDSQGIGIGSAMKGLANAGMVDMTAVAGAKAFDMNTFEPGSFASMNVAEMGMAPAMMSGALGALPVGAATAALESLQENPEGFSTSFSQMSGTMTGAIGASMTSKGMGSEMMGTMGASIGIEGIDGMSQNMQGIAGMEKMGKAMSDMGMDTIGDTLNAAFTSSESGITSELSGTVGMISGAISGKSAEGQTAVQVGNAEGSLASGMAAQAPVGLEMPADISEAGMMMGAMIMAKPTLAGGLPGAMAPPDSMTAVGVANGLGVGSGTGSAMAPGTAFTTAEMGSTISNMTDMSISTMNNVGMAKMATQVGMTPGMVASMGAAGMAGLDVTSVMTTSVAGLGSEAIQGMAAMAASGNMSSGMMGDMMQTGLVNQGTMAAMGTAGMGSLSEAMGDERWRHVYGCDEWWYGWNGYNGYGSNYES